MYRFVEQATILIRWCSVEPSYRSKIVNPISASALWWKYLPAQLGKPVDFSALYTHLSWAPVKSTLQGRSHEIQLFV